MMRPDASIQHYKQLEEAEKAGRWLRKFRTQAEMSQAEFNRTLGIDKGSTSRWERGIAPVPEKHRKEICRILNFEYANIWEEK